MIRNEKEYMTLFNISNIEIKKIKPLSKTIGIGQSHWGFWDWIGAIEIHIGQQLGQELPGPSQSNTRACIAYLFDTPEKLLSKQQWQSFFRHVTGEMAGDTWSRNKIKAYLMLSSSFYYGLSMKKYEENFVNAHMDNREINDLKERMFKSRNRKYKYLSRLTMAD